MMNASANGFNPIRWNCGEKGCYNKTVRPRIEYFAECFPRKIAMTDIDGIVELGGNFLMLEWKQPPGALGRGQQIMIEKLTAKGMPFRVYVATGNSQTLETYEYSIYENGMVQHFLDTNLDELRGSISEWASWADRNRR
jgi:hypothetical protein